MRDLDLEERLMIFADGSSLLEHIDSILSSLEDPKVSERSFNPIALVLIDINMHGMNGMECVKTIKERFVKAN